MASFKSLPFDIVSIILDECDNDTLHSLCVVSRNMKDNVQLRFFSEIHLNYRTVSNKAITTLTSVLTGSPHLASAVRRLDIRDLPCRKHMQSDSHTWHGIDTDEADGAWIAPDDSDSEENGQELLPDENTYYRLSLHPSLSDLLSVLSSLEVLRLKGIDFACLSKRAIGALRTLCRRTHMRKLRIKECAFDFNTFCDITRGLGVMTILKLQENFIRGLETFYGCPRSGIMNNDERWEPPSADLFMAAPFDDDRLLEPSRLQTHRAFVEGDGPTLMEILTWSLYSEALVPASQLGSLRLKIRTVSDQLLLDIFVLFPQYFPFRHLQILRIWSYFFSPTFVSRINDFITLCSPSLRHLAIENFGDCEKSTDFAPLPVHDCITVSFDLEMRYWRTSNDICRETLRWCSNTLSNGIFSNSKLETLYFQIYISHGRYFSQWESLAPVMGDWDLEFCRLIRSPPQDKPFCLEIRFHWDDWEYAMQVDNDDDDDENTFSFWNWMQANFPSLSEMWVSGNLTAEIEELDASTQESGYTVLYIDISS